MEKSKVYFTSDLSPQSLIKIYEMLGVELKPQVAIKVHSGEKGNQNFLHPDFFKPLINRIGGTIVECNTAYDGQRNTTEKHIRLMEEHGWSKYFDVDIMDAEGDDMVLDIKEGKTIHKNYVGKNLARYNSMAVLSHFKGHPMGGCGGALKQLSIGVASSFGKAYIHGAGDPSKLWAANHDDFLSSMADAAKSVVDYFKGNMAFVNVMKNMSVDCDCCAVAEDPCLKDIGILASTDPVAIDRACIDLVLQSNDSGKEHFMERVRSRNGEYTIKCAVALGIGSDKYELIDIAK